MPVHIFTSVYSGYSQYKTVPAS
eukprot:SAG22_NODE_1667_length_3851_cov_1.673774_5_plen_22_part_01